MRLFPLILWLSVLFCAFPAFAQNQEVAPSVGNESRKAYNERWIEAGSQCINVLLARAKLTRKQIWNDRFADLKTLCLVYERYWYFTNLYADGVGILRQNQDVNWLKNAFDMGASKGPFPDLEIDFKVIQKFRKDIVEFSGDGSILLVDSSILRFNPGATYTLEGDKQPPVAESEWPARFYYHPTMGDYWPYRKRFWGDPLRPGSKE